ncbi:MAG: hypothetical protein EYC69_08800 [Bacteroidetes bacterium]|nr:MAG: hypothetical protein EYC69_08800 [Bacteroidota bacterium]
MRTNTLLHSLLFSTICMVLLLASCSKEDTPENPYDDVDYSTPGNNLNEPDPNSIAGLHKNIFFPKCANPGCHDGTFEPDYRTIESSYATLVYQPVNKLTLDSVKIYSHRVIPNNVTDSWLIERLVTSTTEYMPSNATRLTAAEIDHVKNWINGGCKDLNGNVAVKPNLQPTIIGYVAVDSVFVQLDTNRLNDIPVNPFVLNNGMNITMAILATDTADGLSATDPANFTVKKIKFSTDKNDFSGAITYSASSYLAQYKAWLVSVPISSWPVGTTVYFRIYVNDGQHTTDSEFPRFETLDYYKTLYAFYVQ